MIDPDEGNIFDLIRMAQEVSEGVDFAGARDQLQAIEHFVDLGSLDSMEPVDIATARLAFAKTLSELRHRASMREAAAEMLYRFAFAVPGVAALLRTQHFTVAIVIGVVLAVIAYDCAKTAKNLAELARIAERLLERTRKVIDARGPVFEEVLFSYNQRAKEKT